jgi:UDP:flavonoid glycosyltransferase YjiC (YdhE family)
MTNPVFAARIAYHGVGEFVEIGNLSARNLSELIVKVTANPNYRDKARWFQKVLGKTRGLDVAADIIERVFDLVRDNVVGVGEQMRSNHLSANFSY